MSRLRLVREPMQPVLAGAMVSSESSSSRSALTSRPAFFIMRKICLPFVCILVLTAGCTVTSYTSPTGEKFSRTAIGTKTSVGELSVAADAGGVRSLKLKQYSNDHTETAAAVTEAAVRAALKP